MRDDQDDPPDLLAGINLAETEHRRWQEKLTDPLLRRAYDLRERAWKAAMSRTGDRGEALALIQEASAIDPEYAPQVAGIRKFFERRDRSGKVSLPRAINTTIAPLLASHGFVIWHPSATPKAWRQGCAFVRSQQGRDQQISIASEKFGKRLGLLVAREREGPEYVYRDHRAFGCAHEELAYLNQEELTVVIARIGRLLESRVIPWLDQPLPGA